MRLFEPSRPACVKQPALLFRACTLQQRRLTTTTLPPKLIIAPGSNQHNTLPSFLDYATRTNLAPSKTYYVGTHYEYTTAIALLRLGFSLLRTGRKSDAGIDLIGHWVLPQLHEPLPVIAQCKARTVKLACAPKHVRELEGAFGGVPAEWRSKDVLALLVTSQKATRGVLATLAANSRPMGFLKITRTGIIEQFVWNKAATERGLEGYGVTLRHTPVVIKEQGQEGTGWLGDGPRSRRTRHMMLKSAQVTTKDIQLTWMGSPVFPDRDGLDEETVRLRGYYGIIEGVRPKRVRKKAVVAKVAVKTKVAEGAAVKKTAKTAPLRKTAAKITASKTTALDSAPTRVTAKTATKTAAAKKTAASQTAETKPATKKTATKLTTVTIVKRIGRPPGSKNKATLAKEAAALKALKALKRRRTSSAESSKT